MKNRIREFRKEKGISQKKLADAIGVSFQSISFFERGDKTPSIENYKDIKILILLFQKSIN